MTFDSNTTSAVYALNSYVWKLLEANLGWDADDYASGHSAIIPLAQQPEAMQGGKPFLTYGAAIQTPGHLYALRTESVAYTIWSTSSTEVNRISELLALAFERQDEAAADVNEWLGTGGVFTAITFGTVKLEMVEKANPADEEGGYAQGLVLLTTRYTVDNNTAQFSGFSV